MKKITLLLAMLFTIIATAQQSFPNKQPELLKDKKVKVINTSFSDTYGYQGFYSDAAMRNTYMPSAQRPNNTAKEALSGKTFTVTAIDRNSPRVWKLTLKGEDGNTVYHQYEASEPNYPFEVIGGLTLPEGFYCELIKHKKEGEWDDYEVIAGEGLILKKSSDGKESFYILTFAEFFSKNSAPLKSVTLLLTGGKNIVLTANSPITPNPHGKDQYRYSGVAVLKPADIALLKTNNITAIKYGDQTGKINIGEKFKGLINCLEK